MAKGRPRFSSRGEFVKAYTPEKTVRYENIVRLEYESKYDGVSFGIDEPIAMESKVYFPIPKGTSKKKMALMEGSPYLKKPDVDNCDKILKDALNGVCYPDDKQIFRSVCEKFYSYSPRVEITIYSCNRTKDNTDKMEEIK